MFKEIYSFLQSKSTCFPYVDASIIRHFFIDKMKLGKKNLVTSASLYNITLETCVQGERERKEPKQRVKKMQRAQFIEILVRFSLFLYCNQNLRSGMSFTTT